MHSVRLAHSETCSAAAQLLEKDPARAKVSTRPDDAGLVNRLDQGTSGILLAAKTRSVWLKLREMIQEGAIQKTYLALVEGELAADNEVENYIGSPNRGASKVRVYEKKPPKKQRALPAQTKFHPLLLDARRQATMLEVSAPSARRHQIRAHAAYLGHPLVGDTLYGSSRLLRDILPGLTLPSFLLHAASVEFRHPLSSVPICVTCPLPEYAVGLLAPS